MTLFRLLLMFYLHLLEERLGEVEALRGNEPYYQDGYRDACQEARDIAERMLKVINSEGSIDSLNDIEYLFRSENND